MKEYIIGCYLKTPKKSKNSYAVDSVDINISVVSIVKKKINTPNSQAPTNMRLTPKDKVHLIYKSSVGSQVPYAAPPVGRSRLLPPQPVEPWEGAVYWLTIASSKKASNGNSYISFRSSEFLNSNELLGSQHNIMEID